VNSTPSSVAPVALSRYPFWKIWANPIFLRYCRSRLRLRGLGVALLITVLIAGFIAGMAHSVGVRNVKISEDVARGAFAPLMVLQVIILFVLGTAQVAGGMTGERDEGVIDYQRLIPMSPLSKVVGYLFGLPVREYVMFLATLPFTAWMLARGHVSPDAWMPIYLVLFTSTLLYHFTGLLTGTVAKNRRWAFLASIGMVFALYTVVPYLANFGLVFFRYLTIWPVIEEMIPHLIPRDMGAVAEVGQRLAPTVKFFNLDFSETVFTLFSQGGLILTFTVMLCRKWRRTESHLLGKVWAAGFFIWVQTLLLGNSLPLIEPGNVFPSRGLTNFFAFSRFARTWRDWKPDPTEAVVLCGVYGMVTLLLLFLLAAIITPSPDNQIRGWRRARKQGETSLPLFSDAATSFWAMVVMALSGAGAWYIFTRGLVESRWFPGHEVPLSVLGYFAAVLLTGGLGFQLLMERKGGRAVFMMAIFVGVVPVMLGAIASALSDRLITAAAWLIGISPVSVPFYASGSLLSLAELPKEVARAIPRAFQFWLFVAVVVTLWQIVRLHAARKAMAASVLTGPVEPVAGAEP